jgi:hypothetical protein
MLVQIRVQRPLVTLLWVTLPRQAQTRPRLVATTWAAHTTQPTTNSNFVFQTKNAPVSRGVFCYRSRLRTTHFVGSNQQVYTCDTKDNVHSAGNAIRVPEDLTKNIKIEQTKKTPVECSDDHEPPTNCVEPIVLCWH